MGGGGNNLVIAWQYPGQDRDSIGLIFANITIRVDLDGLGVTKLLPCFRYMD